MPNYVYDKIAYDAHVEGTTTQALTANDGSYLYYSLTGWPNEAMLRRLRIYAVQPAITGNIDLKILSSPAIFREVTLANTVSASKYVFSEWNNISESAPADTLKLDIDFGEGIYIKDATLSNQFHLYIESEGISNATKFHVEAWGSSVDTGVIPYNRHNNYSIRKIALWRNNEYTKTWTDITLSGLNKADYNGNRVHAVLNNVMTPEYLYIGNDLPFSKIFFLNHTNNTTSTNLVVQYYRTDGTWQTLTVYNNTDSRLNGSTIPFSYSGSIIWDPPSEWRKSAINMNGIPPDNEPRYWVRLGLNNISTNPIFYYIRPEPFDFSL